MEQKNIVKNKKLLFSPHMHHMLKKKGYSKDIKNALEKLENNKVIMVEEGYKGIIPYNEQTYLMYKLNQYDDETADIEYEYDFNEFSAKSGTLPLDEIKKNPVKYINYTPDTSTSLETKVTDLEVFMNALLGGANK